MRRQSGRWGMRLKAIASPSDRRRSSRWRSAQLRKWRRPIRARRDSVLDAARLFGSSCAALEGAYLLEDRVAARSFSRLGPGGGPRLRGGTDGVRQTQLDGEQAPRAAERPGQHSATRVRRAVTRQPLRSEGRGCRLSGVMASDRFTGHRSRNLWPDRRGSPGNPGGSGHRNASRDSEKSLLTRCYARLPPTFMVRKGSTVRVRQRAFGKCLQISLVSQHLRWRGHLSMCSLMSAISSFCADRQEMDKRCRGGWNLPRASAENSLRSG
jgi:hypothetical protein